MLKVIQSLRELNYSKLMSVYLQSNQANGRLLYPHEDANLQVILAEQDFLTYLKESFFQTSGACYAIWEESGTYLCALRLEPYLDGMLLEALETIPSRRGEGIAKRLVHSVLTYLAESGKCIVYSHVGKKNQASLKTHFACGFSVINDRAVYIDGSVDDRCYTLKYSIDATDRIN